MRSRLLLALAALLAFAPLSAAQGARVAHFAIGYDVAVEQPTFTYCKMLGVSLNPWNDPMPVGIPIKTTGSSQTVDAVTATSAPFAKLAVGDAIFVVLDSATTDMVWITAKASDDQITVNSAVDWDRAAGYTFSYLDLTCGTGADDGWVSIERFETVSMTVEYEAGDLTGLDVVWEMKDGSLVADAVQVYPGPSSDCGFGTLNTSVCTYANTGDRQTVVVTSNTFAYARLGLAWRGADAGTREDVHGIVAGR
jgi:hypothetical protein